MKIIENVNVTINTNQPSLKSSVNVPNVNVKAKVQVPTVEYENDYNKLSNIPTINGVEVKDNKNIEDFDVHTSQLINNGDGESPFATEDYVEQNGGKIDKILLNDNEQQIVNKTVNLKVDKNTVGLSNVDNTSDLNKPISTQTQTALDELNQTITNNFNNLNSSIENETERATLAETEINTKLQQEMNTRVQEHSEIQGKIDVINSKIPNQASSTNQLADKAFVNSTINSSAAFFKGSFESKAALDAVQWQTTDSSLATYVSNNDYAYIETDETHNNEAWRYIYVKDNTVSEWQPQFRVNESPFTQAQLDAINSGATTDLINSINSKLTQDAIVDNTGDSSIKAISQRAATLGINTVQSNLNTHILDKNNPHQVTKAQIGLGNVDNTSDLDKPISNAVRAALNDYLLIANVDSSLNSTSVNPVQNKVLYAPVTFAESERQKSKNLIEVNNGLDITNLGLHVQINNDVITVDGAIASGATAINVATFNPKIYAGKTYTLSFKDYSNVNGFDITVTGTRNDGTQRFNMLNLTPVIMSTTITADVDYELKIEVYAGVSSTISGTFKLQLEEGSVASDYQPYNGAIVHEKELDDYITIDTEQTISGKKTYTQGLIVSGRPYNSGDDEGIVITRASNNYAGLCLGSPTGARSVHYLMPDNSAIWRWSNGNSSYDIKHPQKAGTIALTSDIPDVSSYVTKDSSNIINNVDGVRGRLFGNDTRSVNGAPSTYQSQSLSMSMGIEFKSASTISAPNSNGEYVLLQTITPWGDTSGGLPSQLSYGNGLAYRTAASSSAWNSWRTIIDSGDIYQTTGTSTTGIMSQKATTDELSNKLSKNTNIQDLWVGTQAEYDAISTISNTTLYFIKEG